MLCSLYVKNTQGPTENISQSCHQVIYKQEARLNFITFTQTENKICETEFLSGKLKGDKEYNYK